MSEYLLAEKPCIDELVALGYQWLKPKDNEFARDGLNQVLLRDVLISTIMRINTISDEDARAVYHDLLRINDNQEWIKVLRGHYSRTVSGENKKKTIRLIDFQNPSNNHFTVTNQLYVSAQKSRKPDLVLFINGIPLVVIEAKNPLSGNDKTAEAFEQIKQYERDIPRLFYSNLFNIVTDGLQVLYGATNAQSQFWGYWRDPWPKKLTDFKGNELSKSLYALCHPTRLLDLLAHFVVFEKDNDTGKVIKKICRYQQFRAVNKIFERVVEGKHKKGLIWHTQGSGKSLTMVYTALKLKAHLTVDAPATANPNILVLTDRINLDDQIYNTFKACDLPNPVQIESNKRLIAELHRDTHGLVLLSTIHKFENSSEAVLHSDRWIVLVDECHRTQEKDLGVYLRATLPNARFFGFTGTPVQKGDLNTYKHFSEENEGYLDKYSIDDAVADGATVPIRYTGRKTEWLVDPQKLDILFDQWFANEAQEVTERLKSKGVTLAELAKHPKRVELIAYDIWTHFHEHIQPDGLKAQIVAIDREAVILYKQALDKAITEHLIKTGKTAKEALELASAMSACVYSVSGEDDKPSEDAHIGAIRKQLKHHLLDVNAEKQVINNFAKKDHPLSFLIVCNKLLTGFDAPIEAVMYLDNPLKEHNLLQAIARTNRVYDKNKQYGLIVDYIGITKKLEEALASYRSEDIVHAMLDLDTERAALKTAYLELRPYFKAIKRGDNASKYNLKREFDNLVSLLGSEDDWFTFRRKAKNFIRAYEGLSPDPCVLEYINDIKWVAAFVHYATQKFEQNESLEISNYSEKIREMLHTHLDVIGISTICKIRTITDPEFWEDFKEEDKSDDDIETAAIRKSTEMKKVLAEKMAENPLRYEAFSKRVEEVLRRFQQGQLDAANILKEYAHIAEELVEEEQLYKESGLDQRAYGLFKLIEHFTQKQNESHTSISGSLKELAARIDTLYASNQSAPVGWHEKEQQRKELRQEVRGYAHKVKVPNYKELPASVEEYALKYYVKED